MVTSEAKRQSMPSKFREKKNSKLKFFTLPNYKDLIKARIKIFKICKMFLKIASHLPFLRKLLQEILYQN